MNFDISKGKSNMGNTDRLVRAGIAILLIIGAMRGGSWIAGLIGVVLLATAYFRFCPGYEVFGIATNKDVTPESK